MSRTWWSGCVLAGVILTGCGDHDQPNLAARPLPGAEAGQQDIPSENDAGQPDAESTGDSEVEQPDTGSPAKTALAPVETPFAGQTQEAKSGHYQMISRVAAPIGSASAGEGTEYRMLTGVISLQEGADQ